MWGRCWNCWTHLYMLPHHSLGLGQLSLALKHGCIQRYEYWSVDKDYNKFKRNVKDPWQGSKWVYSFCNSSLWPNLEEQKPNSVGKLTSSLNQAVKPDKVVLVVVCRDSNRSIVATQSQEECPCESLWAKSKAVLLAANLAHKEGFARRRCPICDKSYSKPIYNSSLVHQCYYRRYLCDSKLFCMSECLFCF